MSLSAALSWQYHAVVLRSCFSVHNSMMYCLTITQRLQRSLCCVAVLCSWACFHSRPKSNSRLKLEPKTHVKPPSIIAKPVPSFAWHLKALSSLSISSKVLFVFIIQPPETISYHLRFFQPPQLQQHFKFHGIPQLPMGFPPPRAWPTEKKLRNPATDNPVAIP